MESHTTSNSTRDKQVELVFLSYISLSSKKTSTCYYLREDNIFLHMSYFLSWLHEMETFSALLALCEGNSPVTGEIPWRRPVTQSFDVFFVLRLNKRLRKQSRRRGFETQSRPLWRHCNVIEKSSDPGPGATHWGLVKCASCSNKTYVLCLIYPVDVNYYFSYSLSKYTAWIVLMAE